MKRMMKRIALALVLALAVSALLPQGAALAAATYELDSYVTYDTGRTTISWSRSGDAEEVTVYIQVINNGTSEQSLWRIGTTTGTKVTTTEMLPGRSYRVSLTDSDNYVLAEKDYDMPAPVTFQDGNLKSTSVKVKIEKRSAPYNTRNYSMEKSLSASKIQSNMEAKTTWYGVKFLMQMPRLAKPRTFFVTLAFESPDGYLYVETAQEITFDKVNGGYQTIWWDLIGTYFFRDMLAKTGTVPAGKYTTILFWDGMLVNQSTFDVGN